MADAAVAVRGSGSPLRVGVVKRFLAEAGLDAMEEINSQLRHAIELCDSRIEGATREEKLRAAQKTEELLKKIAADKGALGVISRRPDSDLQKAAETLTELETLEYGKATTEHLSAIFDLLVILDPGSEQAALLLQARARGNILRKDMEATGGDVFEAHRKQQQYKVFKEQIEIFEGQKKKLLHTNGDIFSHPIFTKNTYVKGVDLSAEEAFSFKRIFALADIQQVGYLGRKQFSHLLEILKIETNDEILANMFKEMDENEDGQIEFEEFVGAMKHHLTPEQLEAAEGIKMGAAGTRAWSRGDIVWAANNALIVIATGQIVALIMYFQFILVPFTLAYFFCFLVAPILNTLEFRPIILPGGKQLCLNTELDPDFPGDRRYKSQYRRSIMGTPSGGIYDFLTTCMLPHGLAVVATILIVSALVVALGVVLASEVGLLLEDEDFVNSIDVAVDDAYDALNASGVKVLRSQGSGKWTVEELQTWANVVSELVNQLVLVFLLSVYLLMEKSEPGMFDGQAEILIEMEAAVKSYVSLKTAISFVTGVLVAAVLFACSVKLAALFGLLSFLLNYIPNVGSMIAMALPLPLVVVDPNLQMWQKAGALIGPAIIQGYVGNVLEPMMFGSSLNMTPMAILGGLVIWGGFWGLPGAVLSVPLLAVQKIALSHANHPLATYSLMMLREDPTVDELASLWAAQDENDLLHGADKD